MKYRSIFISDVHLGTSHSRSDDLHEFLKDNECDYLFLVGDLIDGWVLKNKWNWDVDDNLILQKLLRKARKGTKIIYLTGNHDEFLRPFSGNAFGNIEILDDFIYTTANGKRYLVIHGDKFDGMLNSMQWISKLGSWLYQFILDINLHYNQFRHRMGWGYYSLSHKIKTNVKEAVKYAVSFENALVEEAKRHNVDGVICGHIHYPDQKEIDGIEYHNTGCWVEMATAIVEEDDGTLKLLKM